jgi:hypothetical protein
MRRRRIRRENKVSETSSVGSQPSGRKEDLSPSIPIRKPKWYELTLMDAQEKVEDPRKTLRESRPSTKFQNSWN